MAERVSGIKGTNLRVFHPADPEPSQQSNLEVNMKMVKSLMLGSAAGLVAMSGAQAADLPVKAKPVEYVKICSLYGAGFFYIPGTDTCIKLGGYLRVDTTGSMAASTISRPGLVILVSEIATLTISQPVRVWR